MKKQTVTVASNRNKELKYSPGAFRDLLNLQIFDIIMGQVDRNPGNYMCQTRDKEDTDVTEITHITGIDNDMCGGLLEYNDIYMTGTEGIDKLKNIEVNGEIQIPVMDHDLAMRDKSSGSATGLLHPRNDGISRPSSCSFISKRAQSFLERKKELRYSL